MKNSEFKVGSHILVQGNRGIVENITRCKEYDATLTGLCRDTYVLTDENYKKMAEDWKGLKPTGRTATYFTVSFDTEDRLKNTTYNHGTYGCLDEFENYGTW